jgi:arylsulfatase A-like enzyme
MAASTAAVAASSVEPQFQPVDAAAPPNVLVVLTDQQRIESLGTYGNDEINTPHIDALAADGVRYTNSFCPYPVCTPSRYSFISGVPVHQHRGWSNHSTPAPGVDTWPRRLQAGGYRTKAVGKMHYTPTYLDVGFDEMVLAEQNGLGRWDDDYHRQLMAEGLVNASDLEDQERVFRNKARPEYWNTCGALRSNLPLEWQSTEWIGERARETVETWEGSGNMLVASFIKPHHPFDPPEEYCDIYDPDRLTPLPGWTDTVPAHNLALGRGYFPHEGLTIEKLKRVMAYYYANIQHIDDQVEKMVSVLKRKGLYDNTLIVYTSDHGEYLGHQHMLLKGNYMYDPVVKVPLVIKYPNAQSAGDVVDDLVVNTDLAPTILGQAGCERAEAMQGRDLANEPNIRDFVFSENRNGHQIMARSHTRKLILDTKQGTRYLYDLEKDPYEMDNRYDDDAYRDDVEALTQAFEEWRGIDNVSKMHLNEAAPVIDQPNVPDRQDEHRKVLQEYTEDKMKVFYAEHGSSGRNSSDAGY